MSRVMIESDALELVRPINSSLMSNLVVGLIVDDCKSLVQEINECVVHFVRRSANSVAHLLARVMGYIPSFREWEYIPPPFICNALVLDSRL